MNSDEISGHPSAGSEAKLFLQHLKDSTSILHRQLEDQPVMRALVSPEISQDEYCTYLLLMKEVVRKYEEFVLSQTVSFFKYTDYQSLPLIEQDLQKVGCSGYSTTVVNEYELPARSASLSYLLGFMYVMEGSRLGGRVILKNIQTSLGYSATEGAGYLAGFGIETGRRWKYFLERLSELVIHRQDAALAIEGANDAFSSIHNFLEVNQVKHEY